MAVPKNWLRALFISVAAIASACHVTKSQSVRDPQANESNAPERRTSTANAEQLAGRLLNLIEHLRTPEDMTPQNIERHMGVTLKPDPSDPSLFESKGRLDATWTYSIATARSSYQAAPFAIRLRFDDGRDNASSMAMICKFAYADYAAALGRLGFEPRAIAGSTRQVNFNHESGSGLHAILYVRRENEANPQKRCVDMAVVDFMPGSPKAPHLP